MNKKIIIIKKTEEKKLSYGCACWNEVNCQKLMLNKR